MHDSSPLWGSTWGIMGTIPLLLTIAIIEFLIFRGVMEAIPASAVWPRLSVEKVVARVASVA